MLIDMSFGIALHGVGQRRLRRGARSALWDSRVTMGGSRSLRDASEVVEAPDALGARLPLRQRP
ncbi:MAG: hypothetical protein R3E42_06870 [Burkholderiaceae bacterium]